MKKRTKKKWIIDYKNYVLAHNERPKTIYSFTKSLGIEETDFYKHFSSFKQLEAHVFIIFHKKTCKLLKKDETYASFSAQNKLLSYYFTFFELLNKNRSFVHFILSQKNCLTNLPEKRLKSYKSLFTSYIDGLDINHGVALLKPIDELTDKSLTKLAWGQFLFVLKFWIKDTSPSFEKTDILIEKMLHTSFQLVDSNPLNNLFDLGKFIYSEIMHKAYGNH